MMAADAPAGLHSLLGEISRGGDEEIPRGEHTGVHAKCLIRYADGKEELIEVRRVTRGKA